MRTSDTTRLIAAHAPERSLADHGNHLVVRHVAAPHKRAVFGPGCRCLVCRVVRRHGSMVIRHDWSLSFPVRRKEVGADVNNKVCADNLRVYASAGTRAGASR